MKLQATLFLLAGLLLSAGTVFAKGEIPVPHAPWVPASSHKASEVRVFKYDGSRQCGFAPGVSLEEMAKELQDLDVTVLSQEKLAAPIEIGAGCGLPTGWANVYTISLKDLPKTKVAAPGKGQFSIWFFEANTIFVAKYDGSLQCMGGGVAVDEMAKELTSVKIGVLSDKNIQDGMRHMTLCGATTGRLNVYEIAPTDYPSAKLLGFMFVGTGGSFPSVRVLGDDLFPWPW